MKTAKPSQLMNGESVLLPTTLITAARASVPISDSRKVFAFIPTEDSLRDADRDREQVPWA